MRDNLGGSKEIQKVQNLTSLLGFTPSFNTDSLLSKELPRI
jgi:hypothetical protein